MFKRAHTRSPINFVEHCAFDGSFWVANIEDCASVLCFVLFDRPKIDSSIQGFCTVKELTVALAVRAAGANG
jgi:hypothetical protein